MKYKSSFDWDPFLQAPIIGIMRGIPLKTARELAQAMLAAGLYTLEITMNTVGSVEIINKLRAEFPQLNIGAGTVCTKSELKSALEAGAQFIVCPITNEKVISFAVANNTVIFPGAYSPTEIYQAWSLGASAVKVFPANSLGPQYIKDLSVPLNKTKLVPTGGVDISNIKSFFQAGAFGVGMSSSLFKNELIIAQDFHGLINHFKEIKTQIQEFIK